MKRKLLITLVVLVGLANTSHAFVGSVTGKYKCSSSEISNLSFETHATDQNEALEKVAKSCFDRLASNTYISEDEGLEVIDICANLRCR